ncbi:hypothetical protein Tco_0676109 [Tanacetum coccineum]
MTIFATRISFDESDNEDYTVIYDKKSFSYKIISIDNLKTDLENDNDKVNMPLFPSSEPMVNYFDDFDYFKDFEKEFLSITYNDSLTSKLDFSPEPTSILGYGTAYRIPVQFKVFISSLTSEYTEIESAMVFRIGGERLKALIFSIKR